MDPLLVGALGGAGGKAVQLIWDSGQRWLVTYFQDHGERVVQRAQTNVLAFLSLLAARMEQLEHDNTDDAFAARVAAALDDPDFSAVLRDAILGAARTDDHQKHVVLARLVAERLVADDDSTIAASVGVAVPVVPHLTSKQLRLLAACFGALHASGNIPEVYAKLSPIDIPSTLDTAHLEGLSCIRYHPEKQLSGSANMVIVMKLAKEATPDVVNLWNFWMQSVDLTSVGMVIGAATWDDLTGSQIRFDS